MSSVAEGERHDGVAPEANALSARTGFLATDIFKLCHRVLSALLMARFRSAMAKQGPISQLVFSLPA